MSVKEVQLQLLLCTILMVSSVQVLTEERYSPHAANKFPQQVYWGDTHLHTTLSVDADGYGGNISLGPDQAYRFAKGEPVIAHNGMSAKLSRPLDFLVVADHAENMGVLSSIRAEDQNVLATEVGKLWARLLQAEPKSKSHEFVWNTWGAFAPDGAEEVVKSKVFRASIWNTVVGVADTNNSPGKFTAFTGYEWTPFSKLAYNLHRVVIFKDDAIRTNQVLPFSSNESSDIEELWRYLGEYEATTGGEVLAIGHNGNLSGGLMFSPTTYSGQPISKTYAEQRSRWEPLYEVTQIKGDSEAHPSLSPSDEFSDYETWNSHPLNPNWTVEEKRYEYARSALKRGLKFESFLEVNPFKFGMIGSTDSHTSLSTADDRNFWGKLTLHEPSNDRAAKGIADGLAGWKFGASGYAAIWAQENTRESLFAAMKRREVYASTGPRITVRFFGGWDYQPNEALRPDLASIGYSKGVPMGGDLANAADGKSPTFLIRAVKDPDGANLDRVQVIKGWHDSQGELHERIYNVALSDGRTVDKHGRAPAVGSTVDVKDASYTNSIGDPELAVVWRDPDFDRDELAFYYLRVLEIPTPRWTAYDAKFFGLKDIPEEIPMITQERAYSSPIWYAP